MGPSGSGKSTLMHCLAGLDQASSGTVTVAGTDLGALDDDALTIFRRKHVGFVFQSFNLLPMLTALQNIVLPLELGGTRIDDAVRERAQALADTLGVADRLGHRPAELSGGQQQRVAIARALITRPGPAVRRRAHREPGQHHLGRRAGAPAPVGARARPDRRDGHPRPGRGRLRRHRDHHAGRADRLMRTVFRASLRTHARRYVAAAIAVIVSVAFVVVIGMITAGARAGIMEVDGAPYRGADFVVDADPAARGDLTGRPFDDVLQTSAAIDLVERLGDNASGLGRVTAAGAHRQRGPDRCGRRSGARPPSERSPPLPSCAGRSSSRVASRSAPARPWCTCGTPTP